MPRVVLIASRDDFLLEEAVGRAVDEARAGLGVVEAEPVGEEATPEWLAVELHSPSLFNPTRVLVVSDAREWLAATAPPGAPKARAEVDVDPLVKTLEAGLPDGVALVMGAWCGRKPKGPLVAAAEAAGDFEWIPVPEAPKPWEDVLLSDAQRTVLEGLLARVAQDVVFTPAAKQMLLERLGFAPRLLVQEVHKLVAAAGVGQEVDEGTVRELVFPRERSLEVVRDAVLERDATTLLDLVGAADAGVPVRDWQGQRLDPAGLANILFAQVFNLLQQMLYLRRLAVDIDLVDDLDPGRTAAKGWYGRQFKSRLAPAILDRLKQEQPTPLARNGKLPTAWTLGGLFAGAGRYHDAELVAALADAGAVEVSLRGPLGLEALSAWLTVLLVSESEDIE